MIAVMGMPGQSSGKSINLVPDHSGQQLHVSGVFIVLLEIALILENLLPVMVVVVWLPASARGTGDRLVAAFSVTCILSALVPTPLGLASYFSGGWYGGAPTCTTYQVTSVWCNLSSLALLTYMCVNCHFAVWNLMKNKMSKRCRSYRTPGCASVPLTDHGDCSYPSTALPSVISCRQCGREQGSFSDTGEDANTAIFSNVSSPTHLRDRERHDYGQNISCLAEMALIAEKSGSKAECDNIVLKSSQQSSDLSVTVEFVQKLESDANSESQQDEGSTITSNVAQTVMHSDSGHTAGLKNEVFQCDTFSSPHPQADYAKIDQNNTAKVACCLKKCQTNFQKLEESSCNEYFESQNNGDMSILNETQSRLNPSSIRFTSGVKTTEGKLERNAHFCHVDTDNELNYSTTTGCFRCPKWQSRDYVSLMLFVLFTCTLAISSLPVIGYGPHSTHTETSCRSWLVPTPNSVKEKTFFVTFLSFVYACLVLGCTSGISACLKVSKRMKQEKTRHSRLYHEEDNVPDILELSILDDLKRHYSLACVVLAGLFTWLPVVTVLTLQKAGVHVSEATIMYSNIATSLPGLLNPLLYSLALARYRTGYKAILEKCCCKTQWQGPHNDKDSGVCPETALNASSAGHTCLHGRVNPNFDSHGEVIADEADDDWVDEGSFDDSDRAEEEEEAEEEREQTKKVSEKTPLQSAPFAAPSIGAFRTNGVKSPWQRQQARRSSTCSDNESLLPSSPASADQETGL